MRERSQEVRDGFARLGAAVDLDGLQATRQSFVTRNLERGASLDELSEATPVVSKRC